MDWCKARELVFDAIFQVLDLYFRRPLWWISIAVTHALKKQLGENVFLFIVRKICAPRQWALLLLGLWLGRNSMAQECCPTPAIQEAERGRWRPQAIFPFCFCSFWVPRLGNNTVGIYSGLSPQVLSLWCELVVIWSGPRRHTGWVMNPVGFSRSKLAIKVDHYRFYNGSLGWNKIGTKLWEV